ncbi:MAG: radical SAM protein [Desulfobacterales bacterium]|nr:radical SAM protein [Desulfobacterales bacterium]
MKIKDNSYIPEQVVLEVTNVCNFACQGCIVHGPQKSATRLRGFMPESVWRSAIDQIASWNKPISLMTHGAGEPLLHPQLQKIITYASQYSYLKTGFLTNGMRLNEAWIEFILSSDMDWICFSIDGIDPNTHAKVRPGSDLVLIEKNLSKFLEIRHKKYGGKLRVLLNMVGYAEVAVQIPSFIDRWLGKVDTVFISYHRNPPQSRRFPSVSTHRKPCHLLWKQMVIAWDGRLGMCCEDFNIDYCLGHLNSNLLHTWNHGQISDWRSQHMGGNFTHPMCQICDTWDDATIQLEEKFPELGYRVAARASQIEFIAIDLSKLKVDMNYVRCLVQRLGFTK